MGRGNAIGLIGMVLTAAAGVLPAGSVDAAEGECDLASYAGIGLGCAVAPGLIEVFGADGASLGFTHDHPDAVPPAGPAALVPAPARDPVCVTAAASAYHAEVIYARPMENPDNYAAMAPQLREMVRKANGQIDAAAQVWGAHADLKVLCDAAGQIIVRNEVLLTPTTHDEFNTIASELKTKGYLKKEVKYWVYYDERMGFGGQGNVFADASPGVDNDNNGNFLPMYAMTYGIAGDEGAFIMLHELGHTLGAVQEAAPHATGAWHCTDGWDVMCYDDTGADGGLYTTTVCAGRPFDCNQDDYFNVNAATGSYLATHWNIGSSVNRYLVISPFSIGPVACPAKAVTGASISCSFQAQGQAKRNVRFVVDWDDASTLNVPSTGFVPNSSPQSAAHAYSGAGTYDITVTAYNNQATPLQASATRTIVVQDAWAPEIVSATCPVLVAPGASGTCDVKATDFEGDDVRYTIDWDDGTTTTVPASGYVAPGTSQSASHTWSTAGLYDVTITATDDSGAALTSTAVTKAVDVRVTYAPTIGALTCSPVPATPRTVECSVTAQDDDSATIQRKVAWGDGLSTTSPFVAEGTAWTTTHTYASGLVYTISATAKDPDGFQSAATTLSFDVRGPAVVMTDPIPGHAYSGCGIRQALAGTQAFLIRAGCATVSASDLDSTVARIDVTPAGACPGYETLTFLNPSGPITVEYPICGSIKGHVVATAYDARGNPGTAGNAVFSLPGECAPVYAALGAAEPVVEILREELGDEWFACPTAELSLPP